VWSWRRDPARADIRLIRMRGARPATASSRRASNADELQEHVVAATLSVSPIRVLELGTGTGETSSRILAVHPDARRLAMDASPAMLAAAQERLPSAHVSFLTGDIRDGLPSGEFDLVVSVLTVHHLDGTEKQKLCSDIADRLAPGGSFVLGDIVLPSTGSRMVARLSTRALGCRTSPGGYGATSLVFVR